MFILQNVFRVNTLYIGYSNKKIAFLPNLHSAPWKQGEKRGGDLCGS